MTKALKNLIISFVLMLVVIAQLIVVMFAWTTSLTENKTSVITANSNEVNGTFTLYHYNGRGWGEVTSLLDIIDFEPEDVKYLKLEMRSLVSDRPINAKFVGINTSLNTNVVKATLKNQTYTINYYDTPIYRSNTRSIMLNDKILYEIDPTNKIALRDYKLEDAIKIYTSPIISSGIPQSKGNDFINLNETLYSYNVGDSYSRDLDYYFALSFDSTSNDNAYMYQKLAIESLAIGK